MTERKRPGQARAWQRMLSGRRLDLLDPSPLDVEIEDIAHGLSRVARWNGQTKGAAIFSVAQHSLLVCDVFDMLNADAPSTQCLTVLLHDAPEYVIGDMISPFKAVLDTSYKATEARLLAAIHHRFGLPAVAPAPLKAAIKRADRIAAFLEATQLAGFASGESRRLFGALPAEAPALADIILTPWTAEEAKHRFLERFTLLAG